MGVKNKKRKTKYTFLLKKISPDEIDLLYGISIESNFKKEPKNRTKIDNLSIISEEQTTFSYLDECKKHHVCAISMTDLVGRKIPTKTNIHCFWCRHQFSSQPIGCPIKYVPSEMIKTYFSEITRDMKNELKIQIREISQDNRHITKIVNDIEDRQKEDTREIFDEIKIIEDNLNLNINKALNNPLNNMSAKTK